MNKFFLSLVLSLMTTALVAQKYVVEGTVKNAETGEVLPYATASLSQNDKTLAAMTSRTDGKFTLTVKTTGKLNLKVSYIGYDTKSLYILQTTRNK